MERGQSQAEAEPHGTGPSDRLSLSAPPSACSITRIPAAHRSLRRGQTLHLRVRRPTPCRPPNSLLPESAPLDLFNHTYCYSFCAPVPRGRAQERLDEHLALPNPLYAHREEGKKLPSAPPAASRAKYTVRPPRQTSREPSSEHQCLVRTSLSLLLRVLRDEESLRHFVCSPVNQSAPCSTPTSRGCVLPADGRAGHRRDYSGLEALEETSQALAPLNDGGGVPQTPDVPKFGVGRRATGLQQRLDDIERRCHTSRQTARQTSRRAVRIRVPSARRVHRLRQRLVSDKLQRREGHRHAQRGRVGHVEGAHALMPEHRSRTI